MGELKSTKNMLMSSLRNIEAIERHSEAVPDMPSENLNKTIEKLERFLISPDDYISMSLPADSGQVSESLLGLRHLTVSTQTPTHSPPTRPSTDDKLKMSPATSSG